MTFSGYKKAETPHAPEYLENLIRDTNEGRIHEDTDDLLVDKNSPYVVNNEYNINTCYTAIISAINQTAGSVTLTNEKYLKKIEIDEHLKKDYPKLFIDVVSSNSQ
jgi:hypothetical protein